MPDDDALTPWRSEEDEYAVLADLLVPAAQQNFRQGLADWDALDTKALGVVGLDAAAIAVLVAAHEAINRFWWIPTIGLFLAGSLLIACVWPRRADLGPDPREFHSQMEDGPVVEAARELLIESLGGTAANAAVLREKARLFWLALAVFSLSLVACLPIALLRPADDLGPAVRLKAHG